MENGTGRTIIALGLVGTLIYAVIFKDGVMGSFMNLMFVVVGYYFGNNHRPPTS
jgi:hypothetical protein